MYTDGTLGYMLQGVSQQPTRVQPEGHVRVCENMLPDPDTGLTSRPGGALVGKFADIPTDTQASTILIDGKEVRVSYSNGYLSLQGYDGTAYTVTDPDSKLAYVGSDMTFYTIDGDIFCVNKDTVVESTVLTTDAITNWGYVYSLGGEFSHIYTVTITYDDGTVIYAKYKLPDADGTDDAEGTSGPSIVGILFNMLNNHPNKKAGTTMEVKDEVMYIRSTTADTFTITARDGNAVSTLKASSGTAESFADIPRYGAEGFVVKVVGESGSTADDVWLRFKVTRGANLGEGFGYEGVWQETVDPEAEVGFAPDTMPHALVPDEELPNTYVFNTVNWFERRVGTGLTNPLPNFVGKKIRDLGEFQSRLWVVAGGYFCATRTDETRDFFRKSATTLVATDPIDIKSNNDEGVSLDYGVAYDKNLLLFASNGQFIITGSTSIQPLNASMAKTTNYEMSTGARPVVAGQTVMLPYKAARYSGVNEMYPSSDLESNAIDSITKVVTKYIEGEIIDMASSANARVVVCATDAKPQSLYMYNFLWENNSKVQSSWHEWKMPDAVDHVFMRNSRLFVWLRDGEVLRLLEYRLDKPVDDMGYHSCLDYKHVVTGNPIVMDRADYAFTGTVDSDTYTAGRTVSPLTIAETAPGEWTYMFYDPPATMLAGVVFNTRVEPVEPIAKDWRGNKKVADVVYVDKYVVDFVDSGPITAYMDNIYRGGEVAVLDNLAFPQDDDPEDALAVAIKSGTFEVPWSEEAKIGKLILQTTSIQPVTYVEVRWYGQTLKGQN